MVVFWFPNSKPDGDTHWVNVALLQLRFLFQISFSISSRVILLNMTFPRNWKKASLFQTYIQLCRYIQRTDFPHTVYYCIWNTYGLSLREKRSEITQCTSLRQKAKVSDTHFFPLVTQYMNYKFGLANIFFI